MLMTFGWLIVSELINLSESYPLLFSDLVYVSLSIMLMSKILSQHLESDIWVAAQLNPVVHMVSPHSGLWSSNVWKTLAS